MSFDRNLVVMIMLINDQMGAGVVWWVRWLGWGVLGIDIIGKKKNNDNFERIQVTLRL